MGRTTNTIGIMAPLEGGMADTALQRMINRGIALIRESYFWGGGFWKVGYYVGTTGAVSEEVVERYIEETEH